MPHLESKDKGNSSLAANQRSCPGVWSDALRGPRDIGEKLDCLKPNLQKMQWSIHRKDA
jgi:hypothetical protein